MRVLLAPQLPPLIAAAGEERDRGHGPSSEKGRRGWRRQLFVPGRSRLTSTAGWRPNSRGELEVSSGGSLPVGGWAARRGWGCSPSARCSLVEEEKEGGRGPAAERGCARRSVLFDWRRHLPGSTASTALFSFSGMREKRDGVGAEGWVAPDCGTVRSTLEDGGCCVACCFLKIQGQRRAGKRSAGILVSSTRQGLPGVGLWLLGPGTATGASGPDRAGIGIGDRSRRGAISGAEKLSCSGALHCTVGATVVKMQVLAVRAGWLTSRKERCGSAEESQRRCTQSGWIAPI